MFYCFLQAYPPKFYWFNSISFPLLLFSHGILYLVTPNWKVIGWSCSAFSILMMELASIEYGKSFLGETRSKYLRMFAFFQIMAFFTMMIIPETRGFNTIKLNSTIGLVFITMPIHTFMYRKTQSEGSKIIGIAIIWGILPAIVYNSEFTLHKYFNYHDISHVLMSILMLIMYFGIKKIFKDIEEVDSNIKETITTH